MSYEGFSAASETMTPTAASLKSPVNGAVIVFSSSQASAGLIVVGAVGAAVLLHDAQHDNWAQFSHVFPEAPQPDPRFMNDHSLPFAGMWQLGACCYTWRPSFAKAALITEKYSFPIEGPQILAGRSMPQV